MAPSAVDKHISYRLPKHLAENESRDIQGKRVFVQSENIEEVKIEENCHIYDYYP